MLVFSPELLQKQDLRNQPRIFVIATVGKQSQSLDFPSECVSPNPDCMISAIAIHQNLTLVTGNLSHSGLT